MREHAVGGVIARVHAHQQAGIGALLKQLGITRPRMMGDPLAIVIEQLRHEGIESPIAAGAVAIDRHDLISACPLGAAHRRVYLLSVEPAPLFLHRRAAVDLAPGYDPAHAFHISHN